MSSPQWRERPDRPMHEDDRLEPIAKLVPYYRNLWIDADFNDEPQTTIDGYKRLYEHYQDLALKGVHYVPKF